MLHNLPARFHGSLYPFPQLPQGSAFEVHSAEGIVLRRGIVLYNPQVTPDCIWYHSKTRIVTGERPVCHTFSAGLEDRISSSTLHPVGSFDAFVRSVPYAIRSLLGYRRQEQPRQIGSQGSGPLRRVAEPPTRTHATAPALGPLRRIAKPPTRTDATAPALPLSTSPGVATSGNPPNLSAGGQSMNASQRAQQQVPPEGRRSVGGYAGVPGQRIQLETPLTDIPDFAAKDTRKQRVAKKAPQLQPHGGQQ